MKSQPIIRQKVYWTPHIVERMNQAAEFGYYDAYLFFNQWVNIEGVLCLVSSHDYEWN